MVRAGENGVDEGAFGGQIVDDLFLHLGEFPPAVTAMGDAGLVGDQDHGETANVGFRDDAGGAVDEADIGGPVKVMDFLDHHAVAVEKQARAQARALGPVEHLGPQPVGVDFGAQRQTLIRNSVSGHDRSTLFRPL